ncbi:hypothetical protein CHS0354_009418 [Potamilus streckersoni]|uniref:SOCS box domain-containing protein n=1 Tax=Potamilus streckersoni TaxID=2493646 RepID=A0AAE0W7V9_9BIVA|nr:hypothetical protein CHS0354_009418 [Potamilus streckersoni]
MSNITWCRQFVFKMASTHESDISSDKTQDVVQNGDVHKHSNRRQQRHHHHSKNKSKREEMLSDELRSAPIIHANQDPKVTAFFEAIRTKDVNKAKSMVKGRNMHLNTRDIDDPLQPTALLVTCELNDFEMVKMLLTAKKAKTIDVNQEDTKGRRPLWVAAKHGNAEIVNYLLNARGTECEVNFIDRETGCSPLYRAILSNSSECVALLIKAKADVNMRRLGIDMDAETPLIKSVQIDSKKICELLINALCKIHAKTNDGLNALHYAVAYRRYEIVELLLQSGMKIMSKSNHGITAMTVGIEHNLPLMVRILIEYGYKMDKRYKWREKPIQHAIKIHSEECAMTLVHQGCQIEREKGASYFFMAVDEKLMRLTRFMAVVQPRFLQEKWIKEKKWPISIYHRPDIYEWLKRESSQPKKLRQLCRGRIFRLLGKYPINKIQKLPLHEKLKEYLSFKNHVKDEFYEPKYLNIDCECPTECPAVCSRRFCPPIEISSESDTDSEVEEDEDAIDLAHPHEHNHNDDPSKCCNYCK